MMSDASPDLLSGHPPDRILIDTGVLRDLVLSRVFPHESRQLLPDAADIEVMFNYLQTCSRRATTAQVAVELNGQLMRLARSEKLQEARRCCFGEIWSALQELPTRPLTELDLEVIAAVGPTDVVLMDVAHRESLCLLTGDTELFGRARKAGLSAATVWQITHHPLLRR